MPSWTSYMKFVQMLDQRNTLVFALIVRQLWKPFRLLKQCPHSYNNAKRHWMTFPLVILWDCSGSPDTLGYVEMKLPSSFWEGEPFTSLLDLNWPWGSLSRIYNQSKRLDGTSIWQCGGFLSAPTDRLTNWFWALVWLLWPGYRPLTRHNRRLLMASLLDILPCEDIST
jgi:hypothetical protein